MNPGSIVFFTKKLKQHTYLNRKWLFKNEVIVSIEELITDRFELT
jgi:hypothetical protein